MTFICRNPDDEAYDEIEEGGPYDYYDDDPPEDEDGLDDLIGDLKNQEEGFTWAELRQRFTDISEEVEDWHGIPMPIPDLKLVLQPYHPMRDKLVAYNEVFGPTPLEVDIVVGGPASDEPEGLEACMERVTAAVVCRDGDVREDEFLRRVFYSRRAQAYIYIYQRGLGKDAKVFHAKGYRSKDRCMDRFTFALNTTGAIDAWDLSAEYKARDKLRDMIGEHHWRQYELSGQFLEYSKRSRLTYVFRKGRPTIALSDRQKWGSYSDNVRIIAVLCLHPIGYYDQSWAGCLTPTDDVIAHLTWMRGDEAGFWRYANQHDPASPEAGL